jgi:hypothetical protein
VPLNTVFYNSKLLDLVHCCTNNLLSLILMFSYTNRFADVQISILDGAMQYYASFYDIFCIASQGRLQTIQNSVNMPLLTYISRCVEHKIFI